MISTFGELAKQYALGLGDIEAIITEPRDLLPAFLEAVARRERGQSFYGMLLLEEQRANVIGAASLAILQQQTGYDERRLMFDYLQAGRVQINGRPSGELFGYVDAGMQQLAGEFFTMCSAVLVRSHTEYARLVSLMVRPRPFELAVNEPRLPPIERELPREPGLVVWGPHLPSVELGVLALALSDFHGSVTFVSSDGGPIADLPTSTMTANDPRVIPAIARASAIVATPAADPGFAIAFGRRGYGILAPQTSGAHEYVRGVVTYDPASVRGIRVGAAMAIAQPASLRRLPDLPPKLESAAGALPVAIRELPLVSIVIPTYNRPEVLRECLTCVAAQTYPNVEAVVVNDAGTPVDDVVAAFPFARLVNLEQNGGCYVAMREGWQQSLGAFVQFVADDDWFYPDHARNLAFALLRSGAAVAHGNGLIRMQERMENDAFETVGFNARVFNDSTTPADAMISTPIAGHSLMWRREVFDEIGFWRTDIAIADQEVQLRAAQRYVFAFVDQVSVEWRIRGESSFEVDGAAEMRRIFEELHPAPGRPLLRNMREQSITNVATNAKDRKGEPVFPATVNIKRAKV